MQEKEREEWTGKSINLRTELKVWEKTFSAANSGRKAEREDIKNAPDIAAKYKEYNKIRDLLSGKTQPSKPKPKPAPIQQTPRKRKHDGEHEEASKRQAVETPSRGIKPWEVDPYDSPSIVRSLFTPLKKNRLGPTPQKDGQALGLFDLLDDDKMSPTTLGHSSTTARQKANLTTPRKLREEISMKHSRTPASAGKVRMLDAFATPRKNINGQGARTPSSVSKLLLQTPSFLRRDSQRIRLPPVDENDDGPPLSPQMVRVPRKPLVRGLSSMLAGLRKMESDAADDDLAMLNELENDMAGPPRKPAPQSKAPVLPMVDDSILVVDSQPGFPLGGFDDEAQFDSDPDDIKNPTLGRDGQPLRIYKKKGQKRTTRRVKMKPTRAKPSAPVPNSAGFDSEDEIAGSTSGLVPDTQNPLQNLTASIEEESMPEEEPLEFAESARNFDSDSQSEYTASEGGTRYRRPNQQMKRKVMGKDGKIKSVARKVTAAAHQNFKRLKLRNSGAKGPVAHNSRFRRRK